MPQICNDWFLEGVGDILWVLGENQLVNWQLRGLQIAPAPEREGAI